MPSPTSVLLATEVLPWRSSTLTENLWPSFGVMAGVPSRVVGERSRDEGFPLSNYGDARYIGWGGGFPIIIEGTTIGAVGVSGLPEEVDMELAQLGISRLMDTL